MDILNYLKENAPATWVKERALLVWKSGKKDAHIKSISQLYLECSRYGKKGQSYQIKKYQRRKVNDFKRITSIPQFNFIVF